MSLPDPHGDADHNGRAADGGVLDARAAGGRP